LKDSELLNEISVLKKKRDVTILAHYYQSIEIQNIADFLGDSLELSRIAKEKTDSDYIKSRKTRSTPKSRILLSNGSLS
jgi:quinolinate synthase